MSQLTGKGKTTGNVIKSQDLIPCSVLPAKKLYRRSHYEHHTLEGLEIDFKRELIVFSLSHARVMLISSLSTIIE